MKQTARSFLLLVTGVQVQRNKLKRQNNVSSSIWRTVRSIKSKYHLFLGSEDIKYGTPLKAQWVRWASKALDDQPGIGPLAQPLGHVRDPIWITPSPIAPFSCLTW